MSDSLFPAANIPDYLLDLEYKGPSFDGMMEIGALKNEIIGLEDALKIIAQTLAEHKKIDFGVNDIQIFVEAFEKASFRKKLKIVLKSLKSLNNYQGAISLGSLLIAVIILVQQKGANEIKQFSPNLAMEIGDQVKVELLKDAEFLKSVANIVRPLEQSGDELYCAVPLHDETTVKYEDKKEFLELSGEIETVEEIEGDKSEVLQGRINRVDLDARVRHLGFKVGSEGVSIPATLAENLRNPTDMRAMLGQWIELEGTTTYQKGVRSHISITKYKVISQQGLFEKDENQ